MCEGVCFEHAVNRGRIAVVATLAALIALVVGVWYSVVTKDVSGGFTLATFAGLPIAVLSLLIALWRD